MESKPFWQSKKFWVTIAAAVGAVLTVILGVLPPEHGLYGILAAAATAIGYVTAQGKVDAARALSAGVQNPPKPPAP